MSFRPSQKITMKELARLAGVDRTSVSRILNRDFAAHRYSPVTVEKVERLAKQYGYEPSRTAHALRTGSTQLIGLLMSDLRNPWFGELASTMDAILSAQGYRVVIADSANSFDREEKCIRDLAGFGVDGLILAPCALKRQRVVESLTMPVVILDYDIYPQRPCVSLDHGHAARTILSHLTTMGRRRAGLVCHEATVSLEKSFLSLSGGTVKVIRPPVGMRTREDVSAQVRHLLDEESDVVVGLNNDLTAAALNCLAGMKVDIPSEVGVIGIDDLPLANLLSPPVTVLSQPVAQYGGKAVEFLRQMIADPSRRIKSVCFPGNLIVRKSM